MQIKNRNTKVEGTGSSQHDAKLPVICRCYICNEGITDEKDKLEMHGEIVCSQCLDDNMYMALQDGGGIS